ncbi:MAG: transcription termination/antitermination factor NusG [Clostridia bacterium]|jgi:transcriptional antiterminator NusG|nr:transcription termination/antitermination factor NusG [Clostridia bacterium]
MDVPEEKSSRLDEFTFIKQEKTDTPKWYVVYTYSGYEDKVMTNLKKTVVNNGLEDLIYDVQVPKEETIEVRNGNRKRVQKKLYPGYVMVKMLLTDQTWYIVRNTRGVTGFVGPGSKPIPLTDVEIRTMGIEDVRISLNVSVGQEVIIVSGPFENFTGKVTEVNAEQQKVKVTIPMFGRDTQVELDFVQVKGV